MRYQLGLCVLACFLAGLGLVGQQPGAPPAVPPGMKSDDLDVLKYESPK